MKGYEKDCKYCVNCDFVWGFMCTCRYSYDKDGCHVQVGHDVHRGKAQKCEYYTTKSYDKDEFFIL